LRSTKSIRTITWKSEETFWRGSERTRNGRHNA